MLGFETFTERFSPRLALASMSGQSDVEWARQRAQWVGCAFLGAFNLDQNTLEAARGMVRRGRDEFLPDDPFRFFQNQIDEASDLGLIVGANVRTVDPERLHRAGSIVDEFNTVLEINAHCRQPEMEQIGCGQGLLRDKARLRDMIQAGAESGALISLKSRFEVDGVDSVSRLNRAVEWGVDILHVDAMDSEELVARLEAPFLIANNGVRQPEHVREYVRYGADAVSVGRAQDLESLEFLSEVVEEELPAVQTEMSVSSEDDLLDNFSFDEIPTV